jgi:hypothetical protein
MTQNAAFLLADALESYAVPGNTTPERVRGFEGPNDIDAWRRHNAAVDLVRAVDHLLTGMRAAGEDVSMFDAALPRWYSGTYMATTPWGSKQNGGGPRLVCPEHDVHLLRALGAIINGWEPIKLDEADQRTLSDVLKQARELLEEESDSLPRDVRYYLWGLIQRAQMVVDNLEGYGPEAVRQVALELGGAMIVQAAHADSSGEGEKASRWRSAGYLLVGGFLTRFGDTGANALMKGAGHVVKQLNGG